VQKYAFFRNLQTIIQF